MLATTHLAVGAATGLIAGKLTGSDSTSVQMSAAFVAGTFSHVFLDAIPHNEFIYNTAYKIPILTIELVAIFYAVILIVNARSLSLAVVLFGMAGGAWLDGVAMASRYGLLYNSHLFDLISNFHNHFHSKRMVGPISSLPIQIIIAAVALILLFL